MSKTAKPGRPAHGPTEKTRASVEGMVAAGLTQEEISGLMSISENTLRKHYAEELKHGKAKMVRSLFGKSFKNAMSNRKDAIRDRHFLLKTRGGYTEKVDLTSSDGSMSPQPLPWDAMYQADDKHPKSSP